MSTCDTAIQTTATVVSLDRLCDENYRIRLECPGLAAQIVPGQFFMIRPVEGSDPLLGRPFALYDTYLEDGQPAGIDVGFHVVGKMTAFMEQMKSGEELEIWGPLGNGFPSIRTRNLIQVAGGIGYTPFVAVSREALLKKHYGHVDRQPVQAENVSLIYGVRTSGLLANMDDLADLTQLDISHCTDDGSAGHHGMVTDLLEQQLQAINIAETVVFTCGPVRMMHSVSELCQSQNVECWASLETPMACGFGACFSCVVPVQTEVSGWDYRRSCMDGPVFPADRILWKNL